MGLLEAVEDAVGGGGVGIGMVGGEGEGGGLGKLGEGLFVAELEVDRGVGAEGLAQRHLFHRGEFEDGVGGLGGVAGEDIAGLHEGATAADGFAVGIHLGGVGHGGGSPVGAEAAGFDEADLDAEGLDLLGEGLAEAFDGELGGVVGREAGAGDASADGGDLEDAA